jgi:hypothetical protein
MIPLHFWSFCKSVLSVPDRRSRDLEVVVVGDAQLTGYWEFGMGREWGGLRKERSVYEQPGTKVDGILSQQGGFPSK